MQRRSGPGSGSSTCSSPSPSGGWGGGGGGPAERPSPCPLPRGEGSGGVIWAGAGLLVVRLLRNGGLFALEPMGAGGHDHIVGDRLVHIVRPHDLDQLVGCEVGQVVQRLHALF